MIGYKKIIVVAVISTAFVIWMDKIGVTAYLVKRI